MNVLLSKYRRLILFRLFRSVNHFQIRFKGKKIVRIKYIRECKFESNIPILRKYKWISVIPRVMIISSLLFENVSIIAPHTQAGTKTPPRTCLWSAAAGSHSNCVGWKAFFWCQATNNVLNTTFFSFVFRRFWKQTVYCKYT